MGNRLTIVLAVLALMGAIFGTYLGGYFCLGQFCDLYVPHGTYPVSSQRDYPHEWQRSIFQPAAKVEGWLRGREVLATSGEICPP